MSWEANHCLILVKVTSSLPYFLATLSSFSGPLECPGMSQIIIDMLQIVVYRFFFHAKVHSSMGTSKFLKFRLQGMSGDTGLSLCSHTVCLSTEGAASWLSHPPLSRRCSMLPPGNHCPFSILERYPHQAVLPPVGSLTILMPGIPIHVASQIYWIFFNIYSIRLRSFLSMLENRGYRCRQYFCSGSSFLLEDSVDVLNLFTSRFLFLSKAWILFGQR